MTSVRFANKINTNCLVNLTYFLEELCHVQDIQDIIGLDRLPLSGVLMKLFDVLSNFVTILLDQSG